MVSSAEKQEVRAQIHSCHMATREDLRHLLAERWIPFGGLDIPAWCFFFFFYIIFFPFRFFSSFVKIESNKYHHIFFTMAKGIQNL